MLALAGMIVAASSCSHRPEETATPRKPADALPPAATHSEVAAVVDIGETVLQEVASSYFEALFSGDVDGATRLSTVPFSLDRKKILHDQKAVESMHRSIARDKGKRPVPKYTISETDAAPALPLDVFSSYIAYRIMVDGEHIDVYVSKGIPQKVVGFSD